MSVRIRLQRHGRKQRPFYHIVVADSRSPRDGRFIERIGTYNPMTKPATIELDNDKAFDWLMKGASPSDTARAILKFRGVLYKKHLARGVKKGALTQEQADQMYASFAADKEAKIDKRREETARELEAFRKAVSGKAGPAPVKAEEAAPSEEAAEETAAAEATEVAAAEATEAAPAEETAAEETPVAEATEEAPAEEAASEEE